MLTLHRDLDYAHANANISNRQSRRYKRFFLYFPPPKMGAGWGGGAQQQQRAPGAKQNKHTSDTE
jgi:hypothetical protein